MTCPVCSSNKTQIKYKDFHINEAFDIVEIYQLYCFDCKIYVGPEYNDISLTGPDAQHTFKPKPTVKSLNMMQEKYAK